MARKNDSPQKVAMREMIQNKAESFPATKAEGDLVPVVASIPYISFIILTAS